MKGKALRKKNAKEMTIDDLAIIVGKGFEELRTELVDKIDGVESKLTGKIESETDGLKGEMNKSFEKVEENFVKIRSQINNTRDHFVQNHKFDALSLRVSHLEAKGHKSGK
jgi:hypothetical protein